MRSPSVDGSILVIAFAGVASLLSLKR
jgi:hypothetical protein